MGHISCISTLLLLFYCLTVSHPAQATTPDNCLEYPVISYNSEDTIPDNNSYIYEIPASTEDDEKSEEIIIEEEIITQSEMEIILPESSVANKKKEWDPSFKPVQLIAPLSMIAVGTAGYYWKGFHKLNEKVRDGMTCMRGDYYLHFDDYIQYVPVAAYLGLGFYKGGRKLDWRERVAVGVTAYLAMTAITNIGKHTFKEKRPDSKARNSFPSGHTATAFTGAELVRKEFGWAIGSGAYVVATGVAFLRLYNGRHWLNDVIAGAGIGILSAQIGYWMLPHYRKWFHWDKKKNTEVCVAMPSYSDGTFAMNLMYVF